MKIKANKQVIESILINLQPFLEKKMLAKLLLTFYLKQKIINVLSNLLTLRSD